MNEENLSENSSENLSEQPTEQVVEQPTKNFSENLSENSSAMKQLFVWEEKASRLELFIRIVYSIFIAIVLMVYSLIAQLCMFVQWIVILILGRRVEGLNNIIKGFLEYNIHVIGYCNFLTDKRPGILPKKTEIYEKEI